METIYEAAARLGVTAHPGAGRAVWMSGDDAAIQAAAEAAGYERRTGRDDDYYVPGPDAVVEDDE